MLKIRKFFHNSALAMAGASMLILSGCDLNEDNNVQPTPLAYVSVYNAIPDAPELDLTVDNQLVIPRGFRFGDNTYYQNFYPGERKFEVSPYGADNVVADTTLTLEVGNAYSIFMADEYEKAHIIVTNDSAAFAEEGKSKLRLINLSPDASPVSLNRKDNANVVIQNQAFKGVSSFVSVDPGSYSFEIVSSTGEQPVSISDLDLRSGGVYTIVVRGYRNPPAGNNHVISAEVVRN
jgi:hypothetical protein